MGDGMTKSYNTSEEQLLDEQLRRRQSYKWIGADRIRCEKCGKYTYVMLNMVDRIYECEYCWLKRRYLELINI